ncbi:MAG: hypothetical protein IPN92_10660 [Chromatiaceae bacterium]|nr:hypothetical protein [Chromatiaceae bacterium]
MQARILATLAELANLRVSGGYELYQLSRERPDFLATLADQQTQPLTAEI